jgi:ATP-dependent helicase/nuclease subunit B
LKKGVKIDLFATDRTRKNDRTDVDPALEPEVRVVPDASWWPAVASLTLGLGRGPADAGVCDLRRVVVVVPSLLHAPALREALRVALAGQACIGPRILTLEAWARLEPAQSIQHRAELFEALRRSPWVRERFGAQSSALWALARDLAQLSDELTLAACGAIEAFEGRWRAAVQRNFSQRAAAAADPQSQLVLALWRAGLSAESGAAGMRARLEDLARCAQGPLLWLVPQGAAPWQRAYCRSYTAASGQPAHLIVGDLPALAGQYPWLGATWPELATSPGPPAGASALDDVAPIAERARQLAATLSQPAARSPSLAHGAATARHGPPMHILRCDSLEDEAGAAAEWTIDRLRAGASSIALIALDRLTARRVRALLERAGVRVADEAGWKLSTTSAAAAVMRWLDLVGADFVGHDLIDWMHSPFTLCGEDDKTALVAATRLAMVEARVVSGRQAILEALRRRAPSGAGAPTKAPGDAGARHAASRALRVVQELCELARLWQRPGPLGRYLGLLESSLDRLGMRPALSGDPVGRAVLQAIEQLRGPLIGSAMELELGEFRALLAEHFEQAAAGNPEVDSPVVMTTLSGTRLRRFDAALLLGADVDHLPGGRSTGGLMANAVRRDLGLRTDLDREREQTQDLAALLSLADTVDATWRCRRLDEPLPLSPLLDRLAMVAELAGKGSPIHAPPRVLHAVAARVSAVRAPVATGRLPGRVSASAYQDLIDCPYRFFALRILGLREGQRLPDKPEKRDFGALLHAVLFEFHRGAPSVAVGAGVGQEENAAAQGRLHRIIEEAFAPLLPQQPALIGYRQRLRLLVPGYIAWLEQVGQEGWRWQAGEVVAECPLVLGNTGEAAHELMLHGRIDRIDINAQGSRRVLDYKSRDSASLRRGQRDAGEDVQLLFYALLLPTPPLEAAYVSLQRPPDPRNPADKVVTLVPAPQPLAEHSAALLAAMADALTRIANGAAMPANGAETVCRRCELRSLCRHGFTAAAAAPLPAPTGWVTTP